ncbi:MAG: hypothetical protein QOD95_1579 [Gammaproteobacteria bacterium]|nr:hypothetical protein [Gammaproteobacteria bacterium]
MVRSFFRVLIVLWAGSLWSTIWVAATLFKLQSDRHLAGLMAARLFQIETYLGLGVAALAIVLPGRTRYYWAYFAATVLAMNEWVLKRVMSLAQAHGTAAGLGFGAWHGVSAVLYLIACAAVLVLVWKEDFR